MNPKVRHTRGRRSGLPPSRTVKRRSRESTIGIEAPPVTEATPLTFRALGLDPALASNIFLTLITDLVGFAGFLGVASLLL